MPMLRDQTTRTWRALMAGLFALLVSTLLGQSALAAPPSTSKPKPNPSKDEGFKLPDFVYGGNAISMLAPVQIGIVNYVPRGRVGLQYDRQIHRPHWVHIGVAGLFDRAGLRNFRLDNCGMDNQVGACEAGHVAGFDVWLGYTYKLYVEKAPYLVPIFRAGLAGGFWKYPNPYGSREQSRELSWVLGLQAGLGLRVFLLRELALGFDLEFRPSLMIHRIRPPGQDKTRDAAFSLPIQILPLIVEWRF